MPALRVIFGRPDQPPGPGPLLPLSRGPAADPSHLGRMASPECAQLAGHGLAAELPPNFVLNLKYMVNYLGMLAALA